VSAQASAALAESTMRGQKGQERKETCSPGCIVTLVRCEEALDASGDRNGKVVADRQTRHAT
jgi:hypothetical protein